MDDSERTTAVEIARNADVRDSTLALGNPILFGRHFLLLLLLLGLTFFFYFYFFSTSYLWWMIAGRRPGRSRIPARPVASPNRRSTIQSNQLLLRYFSSSSSSSSSSFIFLFESSHSKYCRVGHHLERINIKEAFYLSKNGNWISDWRLNLYPRRRRDKKKSGNLKEKRRSWLDILRERRRSRCGWKSRQHHRCISTNVNQAGTALMDRSIAYYILCNANCFSFFFLLLSVSDNTPPAV